MMDIIQNSIRAGATQIGIEIEEDTRQNCYRMVFTDNGTGMSEEVLANVADPFYTTRETRKVGMGLSLLKQNAERTGGGLEIESLQGKGTRVSALFTHDHLDRPEAGDLAGSSVLMMMTNPQIGFVFSYCHNGLSFSISTAEIKEALGDVPISDPGVYQMLVELINENIRNIRKN